MKDIEEWFDVMKPHVILLNLKLNYAIGEMIGKGNFANVYEGFNYQN